ncbi:MAG TPA: hypothetical protein VGR02_20460 [Thermoanaerobaculia bacterium]|jgi:hypothetical protein|nr:hypothetical protein [Thermoanaerobaculia bacterium]
MPLQAESLVASHDHLNETCFDHIYEIYYGTDDGFDELRPREEVRHDAAHVARLYEIFARFQSFHAQVGPERREHIHYASVVGGLYGLNLIPIFRPREITFFDVNPHEISFFQIVRRVWIGSETAYDFLTRLARADYEVETEQEEVIRTCIAARQNGTLQENRGRSARTLLSSWRYALDNYALTRRLLAEVPVHTRLDNVRSAGFAEFVGQSENLWLFCSNVLEFVNFDLRFDQPRNAALFATYYDRTDMLDLAAAPEPVTVHLGIPMSVALSS